MTSYTVDIRQRYRRAVTVATDPSETVYRRSVSFLYVWLSGNFLMRGATAAATLVCRRLRRRDSLLRGCPCVSVTL